jgi:hypothetical protein
MNPRELVLDDGPPSLREVKIREAAATERARIESTETTKRETVKEKETTRRAIAAARGDWWFARWLIMAGVAVILSLVGYFAYRAKLESGKPPVPPLCHDEISLAAAAHSECTPGAIGHVDGDHFVCTCIRPLVVEAPAPQ